MPALRHHALAICVLAGALTLDSPARAGQVSIDAVASAPGFTCKRAYVQAESLDDRGNLGPGRRTPVSVPGRVTVDLPAGTWRISLKGEGCLGNHRIVRAGAGDRALRLTAWPAAVLSGTLVVPTGHGSPSDLLLTFAPAHRLRQGGNPQGKASCTVARGGKFHCLAPATRLDLRLSARGYAAAYSWDTNLLATKPTDLGRVRLVPGGSLAGWVATADGSALPSARISAAPAGLSHATTEQEGRMLKLTAVEGTTRKSGFFHLTGLQGGDYDLSFHAPGYAEGRAWARVTPGREAQLRDPVILTPPLKLSVVIDPPVAPDGSPWRLLLGAANRYRSHLRPIDEASVPASGWYERSGLNSGPYLVKLLSSRGAGWATREVDLGRDPMPVTIEVGAVQVSGDITLGDDPLARATIWFGGRSGAERVELRADEEGHYETLLPRPGTWKVDISAVDPVVNRRFAALEVPAPAAGKQATTLDIRLADTTLSGEIRMRDGSIPDYAAVRIWPLQEGLWAGAVTHRVEGRDFSVRGLAEGSYFVNADSGDSRAASQLVSLSEDEERHVVLVLDRYAKVRGRVVSEGHPVSGALVIFEPLHELAFLAPPVYTDAEGRFEVLLPPETPEAVVQLAAPGRTYTAFRVAPTRDAMLLELPGHGGDLSLDFEPGLTQIGSESTLMVFRDSAPLELGTLLNWARLNPGEEDSGGGDLLVARSLAAGHYEACSVPKGAFVAWMRGARQPARCASGNLSALGSLHLRVPRGGAGRDHAEP